MIKKLTLLLLILSVFALSGCTEFSNEFSKLTYTFGGFFLNQDGTIGFKFFIIIFIMSIILHSFVLKIHSLSKKIFASLFSAILMPLFSMWLTGFDFSFFG